MTRFLPVAVTDSVRSYCRMTPAFSKDLTPQYDLPLLPLSTERKLQFVSKLNPRTIRRAPTPSCSLAPSFSQCVPNPLVVGVKQVWDLVWSVSTVGVIIQRTAAPGTLRQMHHPGTNLKRSNISSIPLLVFPLMQYFKSYYLNQGLCFICKVLFSIFKGEHF